MSLVGDSIQLEIFQITVLRRCQYERRGDPDLQRPGGDDGQGGEGEDRVSAEPGQGEWWSLEIFFLSLFKYFILMCQVALLYTMPDQDTVMKLKCVSMGRVSKILQIFF